MSEGETTQDGAPLGCWKRGGFCDCHTARTYPGQPLYCREAVDAAPGAGGKAPAVTHALLRGRS